MTNLAEFLLARIAEDEAAARESASVLLIINTERCNRIGSDEHRTYLHFDRHGPTRVLAECEAKRRIVAVHYILDGDPEPFCWNCDEDVWPCKTMAALAQVYADHPDYDEAWRWPETPPS